MKHTHEVESTYQMGTVIGSGGTVTATGVDWSAWEPSARLAVTIGATPSGTVVATLQQGTALADGYTAVGTINTVGNTGGTAVYEFSSGQLENQYLRVVATCTGGTALTSASIIGKRRTVTA
ncbi:MAG: hypothetical protein ACSLFP_16335 [Acidimicrobiales bacterium]